jgi:hypothetical protein
MKAAFALLLALGAIGLASAGCGGGGGGGSGPLSKEDYEGRMQALQAKLSDSAEELSGSLSNPTDLAAVADGLDRAADLLDEAAEGLDGIEPPSEIRAAHQSLIDNASKAGEQLRELADKVRTSTVAELGESIGELTSLQVLEDLGKAVSEIKGKGYDIDSDG